MASNDNITFTKNLGGSNVSVTIDTTNMDKDFTKQLQSITTPKSSTRQDTDPNSTSFGPNDTKIVDLLRMEIRYEIDGNISQGAYSGDTHSDVTERKNDLENMHLAGGTITFNYDDETGITGVIEKLKITKLITDGQSNDVTGLGFEDGEAGYSVKMTIIKGVDFGG